MKAERDYQSHLIRRLKKEFEGCYVLKNDPDYIQGIPDLTILYHERWATLEVKRSSGAPHRPNQDYYVHDMASKGYSSFVFPENEEDIFDDLRSYFMKP